MLSQKQAMALGFKVAEVLAEIFLAKINLVNAEPSSIQRLATRMVLRGANTVAFDNIHRENHGREFTMEIGFELTMVGTLRDEKVTIWLEGNYAKNKDLVEQIKHILERESVVEGSHVWKEQVANT